jgi:hypothetical protein
MFGACFAQSGRQPCFVSPSQHSAGCSLSASPSIKIVEKGNDRWSRQYGLWPTVSELEVGERSRRPCSRISAFRISSTAVPSRWRWSQVTVRMWIGRRPARRRRAPMAATIHRNTLRVGAFSPRSIFDSVTTDMPILAVSTYWTAPWPSVARGSADTLRQLVSAWAHRPWMTGDERMSCQHGQIRAGARVKYYRK